MLPVIDYALPRKRRPRWSLCVAGLSALLLAVVLWTRGHRERQLIYMGYPRTSYWNELITWSPDGKLIFYRDVISDFQNIKSVDRRVALGGIEMESWIGTQKDAIYESGFTYSGWSAIVPFWLVVTLILLPNVLLIGPAFLRSSCRLARSCFAES